MQLTNLIVKNLTEDPIIVSKQKLVITGLEDVPLCIQDGLVTELTEVKTAHEEADIIMINQMLWTIATNPSSSIKIQCDDTTDVFALMVHYVHKYQLKNTVLMEAAKSGRQVIDIHLSIEKMVSAGYDPALILPLHAISGCDTVAAYSGIAKKKKLNEVSYGGQEVVNYWRFNRRQRRCI